MSRLGFELEGLFFLSGEGENVGNEAGEASEFFLDEMKALARFGGGNFEELVGKIKVEVDVGERCSKFVGDLVDKGDTLGGESCGSAVIDKQEHTG